MVNCHCQFCRRAHGAAFATVAMVPTASFRLTHGADALHERVTEGVGCRAFCIRCGTRIYNRPESAGGITMLVVASLDDPSGLAPVMHVNVESKAPWYEIRDELPRFPGLPPGSEAALDRGRDV